jgi:hypothetical protein
MSTVQRRYTHTRESLLRSQENNNTKSKKIIWVRKEKRRSNIIKQQDLKVQKGHKAVIDKAPLVFPHASINDGIKKNSFSSSFAQYPTMQFLKLFAFEKARFLFL